MEPALASQAISAATEIAVAALAHEDPNGVLDLVVRSAAELTCADLGLVMARGGDDRLVVEACHSGAASRAGELTGAVLSAQSGAARVARGGSPVMVDDVTRDARTAPHVPEVLRWCGSFAAAPFGTRRRGAPGTNGALGVYRAKGAASFTAADVELLVAFAAQAGMVLVLAEGSTAHGRVAVYQERERLARDLHDVVVQRLYATGMQLDVLARRMHGEAAATLSEAVGRLDDTIAEVRATVRSLRSADPAEPAARTGVGLFESVRAEAATAGRMLGFEPALELSGDAGAVPDAVADHARAALRESLSNVVRHAGARAVRVRVHIGGDQLLLRVADDGRGVPDGVTKRGMRHLEERAAAADGWCSVRSPWRGGTIVTWEVPLGGG